MDLAALIAQLAAAELPDLIKLGQALFGELDRRAAQLAGADVAKRAIDAGVDAAEAQKFPK